MPAILKLWLNVACLATAAMLLLMHTANCQETREQETGLQVRSDLYHRYYRLVGDTESVYQITFDGLIHHGIVNGRFYRTPMPLVEILTEPRIARELEIVESQGAELEMQKNGLNTAVDRAGVFFEKWSTDHERLVTEADSDRLATETLNILEPAVEKTVLAIRESLIDFQSDRFKQVLIQLEISRRGILWFFESKLGDEIGLSADQKIELKTRYVDQLRIALKEIQDYKKKAIEELFSVMPPSSRENAIRSVGDKNNLYRTPLNVMILQLGEESVESFAKYDAESRWPRYSGISFPFFFKVNSIGGLVFVDPSTSPTGTDSMIPDYLMGYCFSDEMELVAEQRNSLIDLKRRYMDFVKSMIDPSNNFIEISKSNNTLTLEEYQRKRREEWSEAKIRMVEEIENVLLPHQLSVMEEFAARTRFSRHGPVAFIFNFENSSKGFLLAPNQKDELWKTARSVCETASQKLIQLEKRLNQQMLTALNDEQKQKLDTLVGRWLELESGNLEFHASLIERPDNNSMLDHEQPIWLDEIQVDPRRVDTSSGQQESSDK